MFMRIAEYISNYITSGTTLRIMFGLAVLSGVSIDSFGGLLQWVVSCGVVFYLIILDDSLTME